MRAAETAVDAARNRLGILGLTRRARSRHWRRSARSSARRRSPRRSMAPSSPARSVRASMCATIPARRSTRSPTSPPCGSRRSFPENDIPFIRVGPGGRGEDYGAAGPRVHGPHRRHRSAAPMQRRVAWSCARRSPIPTARSNPRCSPASRSSRARTSLRPPCRRGGDPGGRPRRRLGGSRAPGVPAAPVKLGIEQDGRVQIREGLKPGELIVARGAIFVDNEWRQ